MGTHIHPFRLIISSWNELIGLFPFRKRTSAGCTAFLILFVLLHRLLVLVWNNIDLFAKVQGFFESTKEKTEKVAKRENEEDGMSFIFTRNAHLYPPQTRTRIHHVRPSVITSIVHPYLPPSLTRIKFTLSPVITSRCQSSLPLKWCLTEPRNNDWQNIEMMEGGKMKIRNMKKYNVFFRKQRISWEICVTFPL